MKALDSVCVRVADWVCCVLWICAVLPARLVYGWAEARHGDQGAARIAVFFLMGCLGLFFLWEYFSQRALEQRSAAYEREIAGEYVGGEPPDLFEGVAPEIRERVMASADRELFVRRVMVGCGVLLILIVARGIYAARIRETVAT